MKKIKKFKNFLINNHGFYLDFFFLIPRLIIKIFRIFSGTSCLKFQIREFVRQYVKNTFSPMLFRKLLAWPKILILKNLFKYLLTYKNLYRIIYKWLCYSASIVLQLLCSFFHSSSNIHTLNR